MNAEFEPVDLNQPTADFALNQNLRALKPKTMARVALFSTLALGAAMAGIRSGNSLSVESNQSNPTPAFTVTLVETPTPTPPPEPPCKQSDTWCLVRPERLTLDDFTDLWNTHQAGWWLETPSP